MPYRSVALAEGEIYHVFTKSISGFKVFNSDQDFERIRGEISYYKKADPPCRFSEFLENYKKIKDNYNFHSSTNIVRVIAYCFMPTHLHLVLQQQGEKGISKFVNLVLKSYSKYFNIKHNRKGPLWEGRFKCVLVKTEDQLLHLTRYVHLNPVTAFIVSRPEDWKYSSYLEYVGLSKKDKICDFLQFLDVDVRIYQEFVCNRIDYQRQLAKIKDLILDEVEPFRNAGLREV